LKYSGNISPAKMLRFVIFVCLSVCLSVTYLIYLLFTQRWNVVEKSLHFSKAKTKINRSKVKHKKNKKNRFCAYLRQKWIDLRQTHYWKCFFF